MTQVEALAKGSSVCRAEQVDSVSRAMKLIPRSADYSREVRLLSAGEVFTMGLSEDTGTAPNTSQHCRNPKVGRASAPAVFHKNKRPPFGVSARLSDREHEQGMPRVWTITKSPRGCGLTIEADRCKQTSLCAAASADNPDLTSTFA
jgi:hypothetical protein